MTTPVDNDNTEESCRQLRKVIEDGFWLAPAGHKKQGCVARTNILIIDITMACMQNRHVFVLSRSEEPTYPIPHQLNKFILAKYPPCFVSSRCVRDLRPPAYLRRFATHCFSTLSALTVRMPSIMSRAPIMKFTLSGSCRKMTPAIMPNTGVINGRIQIGRASCRE